MNVKYEDLTQEEIKELDELIIKAMTYGYLVHAKTEYCVFVRFHGHVESLEIEIRKSIKDWQTRVCETEMTSKTKEYYNKQASFADLKGKIDVLKNILDTHEIPYDAMDYTIEQIKHHYF